MLTSRFSLPSDITRRVLLGVLAMMLIGFFVQIFGPLRIDTDVVFYLSIAASFADGHGLNLYGIPSPLPVGYPIVLGLMDRAGLACSPAFVSLNLVFLLVALALLYPILRADREGSPTTALSVIVLFVSTFVLIKYFPRARSEVVSLCSTWAPLLCFVKGRCAQGRSKVWWLLAGAVLMVPAIMIRAIAAALVPAFACALIPPGIRLIDAGHRARLWWVLLGSVVLAVAVAFWAVTSTDYVHQWVQQLEAASLRWQMTFTARAKLNELGQVALNLPQAIVPRALRVGLKITGFMVCLLILRALWSRRREISTVDVFVLANVGILFMWPGDAPRFWLPILPFIGLYVISAIRGMIPDRPRLILVRVYVTMYVALGIGVQVVMTREAFSDEFATAYGNGSLAGDYQAAARGPGHGAVNDTHAFRVLLRYDANASTEWDRTQYPPYRISGTR